MSTQRFAPNQGKARGECMRTGMKVYLEDLVKDGEKPNLLVLKSVRDIKHPAHKPHFLGTDAIALRHPAPELDIINQTVTWPLYNATNLNMLLPPLLVTITMNNPTIS